jgi:hypothetical protein
LVLLCSFFTSSSCLDLCFQNIPCECKYFCSLNLTSLFQRQFLFG